jgi:hypothetical protein
MSTVHEYAQNGRSLLDRGRLFYTTMPLGVSRRRFGAESIVRVHEIAAGGSTSW